MIFSEERKQQLIREMVFTASRSSGPGGQHVNKVSSRIELRFSVDNSRGLNDQEKQVLHHKLKNRMNANGELLLTAQRERSQQMNKEHATKQFFILLEKALTPQKKRRKTKPTAASRLKRLEMKKKTALKKKLRKLPEQ